ncbi:MAG: phage head-tail connector protein [Rhizobiales bacterium]|nr:phage head-tail connector protein [Hyphomicrobiales bacterium]
MSDFDGQVRVVTAPTIEPVTLAEAKVDLRVDHTEDDTLITGLIVAARQEAEVLARRALINRTLEMALCGWPATAKIYLPYPPAVSVTSVTYYDISNVLQTMTAADYMLISDIEPAIVALAYNKSWPSASLREVMPVRVRWVAGYGATAASVPDRYKVLIRSLVAVRYESRDELTPAQERQLANIRAALQMEWGW